MKLFSILLTCLVTLSSLVAQNKTSISASDAPDVIKQNYLLLTEKNNRGTFTLSPNEILCVRFEDTETYTQLQGPNGPFMKETCHHFFQGASSDEYLQLAKNLTGLYPDAELGSSSPQEAPHNTTTEKEWIFEAKGTGTTTLTFTSSQSETGYNGAPSPDCVMAIPLTFTIITKTD